MSVYQRAGLDKKLSSILRVNKDTFASLVGEDDVSYKFKLSFSLSLTDKRKNPRDYEKVTITIKRRDNRPTLQTSSYSNTQRFNSISDSNNLSEDPYADIKPNNGIPRKKMSNKLADKVYSGLLMLRDLDKKEIFLEQIDVPITPQDIALYSSNLYEITELVASNYKPKRKDSRSNETRQRENVDGNEPVLLNYSTSRINPLNTLERINRELVSITSPVFDDVMSRFTSESHLDNPKNRISVISRGKNPMFYDIVKYYLDDVPVSPEESKSTFYDSRKTTKQPEAVEIVGSVSIKKENKNQNLEVRFDLFKRGSNVPEETISTSLYLPSHIEAFSCILNPPLVKIQKVTDFKNRYVLTVSAKEKIGGFNVYLKSIQQDKTVSNYKLIGSIKAGFDKGMMFDTLADLSVIRVISLDTKGKETHSFSDSVVGPGHKVLGKPIILPSHFGKNEIRIDVLSVPDDTVYLTLYRRDCTDGPDNPFSLVNKLKIRPGNTSMTFTDRTTQHGRVYEYYAVALCLSKDSKEEIPCVSNYVLFKNIPNDVVEKSITVNISNLSTSPGATSFRISTATSKSENERITQTLKSQIGEMYQKYLDPSSNSSSPLGDSNGTFQYADLFFHEIVRTNLVTGERETFELISDGLFSDAQESQKTYNVKPLDKRHSYYYQIFTFRKNPLDLFKKFVSRGLDDKGREWFYLPYKWKNPATKLGKLYPDDKDGIPIIDAYENFTSESFGLTASVQNLGEKKNNSLSQININRIDVNTVKISWEFDDPTAENSSRYYDSFVVMKVVNGVRSFVGVTHKNYIYHDLSPSDVGSNYYIIVPVLENFEIGTPSFSDILLIEPEGISPKTMVINTKKIAN